MPEYNWPNSYNFDTDPTGLAGQGYNNPTYRSLGSGISDPSNPNPAGNFIQSPTPYIKPAVGGYDSLAATLGPNFEGAVNPPPGDGYGWKDGIGDVALVGQAAAAGLAGYASLRNARTAERELALQEKYLRTSVANRAVTTNAELSSRAHSLAQLRGNNAVGSEGYQTAYNDIYKPVSDKLG